MRGAGARRGRSRIAATAAAVAALGVLGACETGPGGTPDPDAVNDAPVGEDPDTGGADDADATEDGDTGDDDTY